MKAGLLKCCRLPGRKRLLLFPRVCSKLNNVIFNLSLFSDVRESLPHLLGLVIVGLRSQQQDKNCPHRNFQGVIITPKME